MPLSPAASSCSGPPCSLIVHQLFDPEDGPRQAIRPYRVPRRDGDHGWEDLYVVNGMFTREDDQPSIDVDSFFWRQVVAQSPLARTPGMAYDDGWRATNRLLLSGGSQAQHERSVLLHNDGHGGFDEVSGVAGVDVDQDGRSFAVADFDHDGDADIVLMAAAIVTAAAAVPKRFCERPCGDSDSPDRDEEQPRRDWSSGHGRDRSRPVHARRQGRIRIPVTAFEGGAGRAGHERTDRRHHDPVAKRTHAEGNRRSGEPSCFHRGRECPVSR